MVKKTIKLITFLIVLTVGVITTAELTYRYLFSLPDNAFNDLNTYNRPYYYHPSPYVGFKGKPHAPTGFKNSDREPILFNSLGYRGPLPPQIKVEGQYRIFVLGGSTVFGDQIDFPSLMQERFHNLGHKNIEVYNFGAVSSGTTQDLARLVFELIDYSPDLIIMYGGVNDFEHPQYHDPRPGYPFNFLLTENNPLTQRDLKNYETIPLVLFKSAILRKKYPNYFIHKFTRLEQVRREVGFGSAKWHQDLINEYWSAHLKASRIANAYNAKYLGVYQPMLYYRTQLHGSENDALNPLTKKQFLEYREALRRKKRVFNFVDMSEALNHFQRPVFKDTCHVYEEYQHEIGKRLVDEVLKHKMI